MAATTRETAVGALLDLIAGAYAWKVGPARRLKLWSDVPAMSRPACFLFEGGQETYSWSECALPKRAIEVKLFIYLNAKDPTIAGAALLNDVMDALDDAFALGRWGPCHGPKHARRRGLSLSHRRQGFEGPWRSRRRRAVDRSGEA